MSTPYLLETRQLAAVYNRVRARPRFMSQMISSPQVFMDTDSIEMDISESGTGMAPFVRSNAPGIATRREGFQTKTFRPAYIKMRDGITIADNQPSWYPGERFPWRTLSMQQKFNLTRAHIINTHSIMKEIREEWMVTQLARTATFNVSFQGSSGQVQEVFPMDYGRNPALTVTPATLWNQAGANPISDLEGWFQTLVDEYEGSVTDVIMGRDVVSHLVMHEQMTNMDNANGRLLAANFDTSRLTYEMNDSVREYGTYRGVRYLTYSGRYHDANGERQYLIKPSEVLILARRDDISQGMMLRGRIRDLETMDRNVDMFQKEWETKDPSGITFLSHASPLSATMDPNFAVLATVL